ncbi:MAG TPA: hypothetical protein VFX58_03840 [Chitinophagaceae bacterium]|nr:hypothetical protein [Chitinophagaceae bacterium]
MKYYIKMMAPLALIGILMATSCSESKTNTQETIEINAMDSTSRVVKENKEKLEEQTRKVEESLEKLDKEFDTAN